MSAHKKPDKKPDHPPKRYNHAYAVGFEIESNEPDGSDLTHDQLLAAMRARLERLDAAHKRGEIEDMVLACDAPWDSYEVVERAPDDT